MGKTDRAFYAGMAPRFDPFGPPGAGIGSSFFFYSSIRIPKIICAVMCSQIVLLSQLRREPNPDNLREIRGPGRRFGFDPNRDII